MKKKAPAKNKEWLPGLVAGLALLYVGAALIPPRYNSSFDFSSFAQIPVLEGGRTKPLDSVARNSLLLISGKQTTSQSAIEWLTNVMYQPEKVEDQPLFEINDPDVLGLIHIQQAQARRFSVLQLHPYFQEIENQAAKANEVKSEERSRFQGAILQLYNKLLLFNRLENTVQVSGDTNVTQTLQQNETQIPALIKSHAKAGTPFAEKDKELLVSVKKAQMLQESSAFAPIPMQNGQWISVGDGLLLGFRLGQFPQTIHVLATLGDALRATDSQTFNQYVQSYLGLLQANLPKECRRAAEEFFFNNAEPFYRSLVLYLVAVILIFISWLTTKDIYARSATAILWVAFVVHTVGLFTRMWLQGRPPVTNLYSSAIFVGWVSVFLGIIVERFYKNGVASLVAGTIGFITLIIAHHLATQGDTMEMMRAVLDSNFWLATHVVTVTIGYSSTFLSGFIATLYLARRAFDRGWNDDLQESLERMVYGVVCFSTLFSFIGTILGGIWADQSWGRFWGWDPKENGALMIVLWNSFILHARWGKLFSSKSIMMMAVFGNIVTSLSWFGVNMLGIGLHSYGFMDKAFVWLMVFIATQFMAMSLGFFSPRNKT